MKEDVIFAITALMTAVIISALPFILCVWVENGHTNYGIILALFVAPIVRKANERKKEKE